MTMLFARHPHHRCRLRHRRPHGGTRRPARCRVIGVDVREPAGPVGSFVKADISSKAGVDDLVASLPQRIDALCNVAGLSGNTGAASTLAVNFFGLRALSEGLAPKLREGGAIVNVASIAGYGWRANLNRAASMAGIEGFPDIAKVVADHAVKNEKAIRSRRNCCCFGLSVPRIRTCSRTWHPRQCGEPGAGRNADPETVPQRARRSPASTATLPGSGAPAHRAISHGGAVPVLGGTARVGQWRQRCGRWRPSRLDQRRSAWFLEHE